MGKARQFAQNSFWLAVSTGGVVLVGAVYRPIIGRILGPTEYGQYSFIQTYVTYFLIIAYFGVRSVIAREVGKDPSCAQVYLRAAYKIRAVTTLAAVVSACAVGYALHRGHQVTLGIYILSISIFFIALNDLLEGTLVAVQKSFLVAVANLSGNVLKLGLGIWALSAGFGLMGVLASFLPASALTAGLNWWFLRTQLRSGQKPAQSRGQSRYILKESIPFLVLFVAWKLYAKNDILFLTLLRGDLITGLYSAGYVFVDLLINICNCFAQAAYPMIARLQGDLEGKGAQIGLAESYERLHKHTLMLFLPISVLLMAISRTLLIAVFGRKYLGGSAAMQVLAWIPPLEVSCLISGIFLSATYRQRLEARIATAVMVVNVAWTISFIYLFGAMGAAVATIGASAVSAVVRYVYIQRSIGVTSLMNTWVKPVLCSAVMLVFVQVASPFLWPWRFCAAAAGLALGVAMIRPYDAKDRLLFLSLVKR